MKIIFLDIDGVLSLNYYNFDLKCFNLLIKLIQETNAKIVISSCWRVGLSLDQLKDIFQCCGDKYRVLYGKRRYHGKEPYFDRNWIISKTPNTVSTEKSSTYFGRSNDINRWLNKNMKKMTILKYIIIDDECYDLSPFRNRLVYVNRKLGFSEKDFNKSIELLKE